MARPFDQRIEDKLARLKVDQERVRNQLVQAEGALGNQIAALEDLQASLKADKLTAADVDFLINEGLHLDTLAEKRPSDKLAAGSDFFGGSNLVR